MVHMSPPDAQSCDHVLLSDILFTCADVMKGKILNHEGEGQSLHDPMGLRGQFRYCSRVAGSEKETRGQRQGEEQGALKRREGPWTKGCAASEVEKAGLRFSLERPGKDNPQWAGTVF